MQQVDSAGIKAAVGRFGAGDWLDLSVGVSRRPWPADGLSPGLAGHEALGDDTQRVACVAAEWFGCHPSQVLPVGGIAAAMKLILRLLPAGRASMIAPGADSHAARLCASGWQVAMVSRPRDLAGADLAMLCNPNDCDPRTWTPRALTRLAHTVGHLLVDESHVDARPDLSLAAAVPENALILRSLGRLWGLAGLRLAFVVATPAMCNRLVAADGPPVLDKTALHVGTLALTDRGWADDAIVYLAEAALRLDRLADAAGWRPAGGTHLFRLYDTGNAAAAQDRLAQAHIWTRRRGFPAGRLGMGIPGNRLEWTRVTAALPRI